MHHQRTAAGHFRIYLKVMKRVED